MEPLPNSDNLKTEPAQLITRIIAEMVRTSPDNRLAFLNDFIIWDEPLVKFADGDDPLFEEYKSIIAPSHLTPREALAAACGKRPGDLPERLAVISWILPAAEQTRKANRAEKSLPSRLWSHTRWYGEKFNDKLRRYLVDFLAERGYLAAAPVMQPYFREYTGERGPYTNWSERHVAYAAGLGTFSLNDGFISERGIAHRCGSVVTSLRLPASPRTAQGPFSNCLFYRGINCRVCAKRCPVGAITEEGHDKFKCRQYQDDIGYADTLKNGYDKDTSVAGCGLCQTKVPCEFRIPKGSASS